MDRDNNLIVSDNTYVRLINLQTQQVQTIAGDGQFGAGYSSGYKPLYRITTYFSSPNRDGIGLDSSFQIPAQLVMDSKGFIYLVDYTSVRSISPQHEVKTIARIESTHKKKESHTL